MSDFIVQTIPIWNNLPERTQKSILKKGSLANQPIKRPYSQGCDKGGECDNCKIVMCGRPIKCTECRIKHCTYEPPCVYGVNHE